MRNNTKWILALAIIKFVLPYLLQSPVYEPHRDEFLYLAEGQHLAWGFMEVPPLLSIFAWLIDLFGGSIFWIKFWPNVFGTLTFVLLAKIIDHLGGKWFAILLVFFPFVFAAWLRMFFLFQPNAPEIFFCALMAYSLFRFIQTSKNKWLYIFGISIGIGLLAKYTVAFWTVSLFVGILFSSQRKIFLNRHFYFGLIIGGLIFLPNFLWQYTHHFPVLHHMDELKKTQLQYVSVGGFLKGEFLMYLSVFFIWIAGLLYLLFSFKSRNFRAFAWAFLCFQILMIIFKGKDYYTAGTFTILFAFGAFYLEKTTMERGRWLQPVMIIFSTVIGLFLWPILLPVAKPEILSKYYQAIHLDKVGGLRWEDLKDHELPQDFADMLAWKEMVKKTAQAYDKLSEEERSKTLLWCDNYGQAGAINFYRRQYNLPQAYSANGSFLFWLPDISKKEIFLVVSDDAIPDLKITSQFASFQIVDSISNRFAVEYGSTILILKHPTPQFRQYFLTEIEKKRAAFGVQ